MESNVTIQARSTPGAAGMAALNNLWEWARRTVKNRKPRRLRVCESLSLGDRRFLAIVEVNRQEFLVGGSGNSLHLLARVQDGTVLPDISPGQESSPQ